MPHPQQQFSNDEILQCAHGVLEGGRYPRLPLPNMLMFDRITRISAQGGRYGRGEVQAELAMDPSFWVFACHFKDDPIMPGSLTLDGLCQLLGFYLGWLGHKGKGRAFGVGEVRYRGEILPTSGTIGYHLHIKKVSSGALALAIADGEVLLAGQVVHTAKSIRVGIVPG